LKKYAVAALAASLVVGPAVAIAGPTELTLKTRTKATKAGTKAKPAAQVLTTTILASPAGNYAAASAVVSLDKNFKFNTSKFRSCSEADVKAGGSDCPIGSKVGTGTAQAVVTRRPDGSDLGTTIASNLTLNAWNGGNNRLYILVQATNPLKIQEVIVGRLQNATGKFGKKLNAEIPPELETVSGFRPTLTKFTLKVGATYKGVPYIQTTGCNGGKWNFASTVNYTDGDSKSATSRTNCTAG
jgi:hypothetical protein